MSTVAEWVPLAAAARTGVLVGGVSLAGTFLSSRSAKQLADANAKEQRQARLHADRISAYQRFRHAFLDAQTAAGQANVFWAARVGASKLVKENGADTESVQHFDSVNATWMQSINVLAEKEHLLQLTLRDLELVASGPVRSAAVAMRSQANELRKANQAASNSDIELSVDRWADVNQKASGSGGSRKESGCCYSG